MSRPMKDSGVEWIGEIPADWELAKIKYILQERNEKNSPVKSTEILSLSAANGVVPYSEKSGGGNKAKEDLSLYKLAYPNDIVMNSMNIIAGSVGLSKYYGCVSPVYYMFYSDKQDTSIRYYSNIFQSKEFQRSLMGLGNGIMMKHSEKSDKLNTIRLRIPVEKMKNIMLPIPPEKEQQKIATFLDDKTVQIEAIIDSTKQSLVEFKKYKQALITETVTKGLKPDVKMKDSGNEWIGEIPEQWDVSKLKRFSNIRYGLGEPPKLSEDGLPIIRATNIERGKIVTNNLIKAKIEDIPSAKDVVLKHGDILIVRSGAYAGDVALVPQEWEGALAGYDMIISLFDINPKFVSYALLSDYILKAQLYLSRMRSAQPHLNAADVGRVQVVVPSLSEQQQIVAYLDEKCAHIDSLIADKEKLIGELEDYKKSLIYEYVTGKKEVE